MTNFIFQDNETLSSRLIKIEDKYHLFDFTYRNIKVYEMVRLGVYYRLAEDLKIFNPQPKAKIFLKLNNIFKYIKNIILYNDFLYKNKAPIMVLEHPRRVNGEKKDIYSSFIEEICNEKVIRLKHSQYGKYYKDDFVSSNSFYYDFYNFKKFIIKNFFYSIELKNFAEKLNNIFCKEFKLNINNRDYFYDLLIGKLISYKIAREFLRKKKVKLLICVNSYGFSHFISAANSIGIKTVEYQHGIISEQHLGYHFPLNPKNTISSFPNYLLTFGKYWNNSAKFPISGKNIIPVGFNYFEVNRKNDNSLIKSKKNILVISQATIGLELASIISKLVDEMKEYKFFYKIHPKELVHWRKNCSNLFEGKSNVSIIDDSNNLYGLLAKMDWQIGVFSTLLYEGIGYNLKTAVLKLNGWQNLRDLEGKKGLYFVSKDTIKRTIRENHETPNFEDFFKFDTLSNSKKILNDLL